MFCTACGSQMHDDAQFCAQCGRPIDRSAPVGAAAPPPGAGPSPWPASTAGAAFASWTDGSHVDAFDIPASFLLDKDASMSNPKLGYVLVAFAVLGLVCALVAPLRWGCLVAGGLVILSAVLFIAQFSRVLTDGFSDRTVLEFLGAGPWIAGGSGVVLALTPLVGLATRGNRRSSPPARFTTE